MSRPKLRVLYVDDEPSMLDVIKDLLETEEDILVNICTSVSEAKNLLAMANNRAKVEFVELPIKDYPKENAEALTKKFQEAIKHPMTWWMTRLYLAEDNLVIPLMFALTATLIGF